MEQTQPRSGAIFSVFKPERREHTIGVSNGDAVNAHFDQARSISIRTQFVRPKAFEKG
jgi:hypothetical protein